MFTVALIMGETPEGILHRSFKTEEEAQAYLAGIEDGHGWLEYCYMDDAEDDVLEYIQRELPENYKIIDAIRRGEKSVQPDVFVHIRGDNGNILISKFVSADEV